MNQELEKRYSHNSLMFTISYIFMGIMSGICFDTLVTFLQEASPSTAAGFSSYMGYGTFAAAIIILLIPKIGYKKVIMIGPIASIAALFAVNFMKGSMIMNISTFALLAGVTLYDAILPPFLSSYSSPENRQKVFSRAIYTNVIGMVIASFTGGKLIVMRFAARLGMSYSKANALTANTKALTEAQKSLYIAAHKDVLLMFVVISVLALIPLLFLKEVPQDYADAKKEKSKFNWKIFANKYVFLFVLYNVLIRFGASLICPYFSVFLGKLGIERGTVSTLVTLQYIAMVIFMMASPWVVKKFGQVVALGGLCLASIPFMLIIANGRAFGSGIVFAVGAALFFRSGFMNAANPVMQSLPMEFVSKELRPAYNSVIFVAGALASIAAGWFTKNIMFDPKVITDGYTKAYYITAAIYTTAVIILLIVYTKKYNRSFEQHKEDKIA